MKKTQKTLLKEMFTKSFDERYAEMSKGEKRGHWIFCGVGVACFLAMWYFGN